MVGDVGQARGKGMKAVATVMVDGVHQERSEGGGERESPLALVPHPAGGCRGEGEREGVQCACEREQRGVCVRERETLCRVCEREGVQCVCVCEGESRDV